MAGSTGDVVHFDNIGMGPATLDVALANDINQLNLTGWTDTLTLEHPLTVSGGGF
jgi:hypothetical protein